MLKFQRSNFYSSIVKTQRKCIKLIYYCLSFSRNFVFEALTLNNGPFTIYCKNVNQIASYKRQSGKIGQKSDRVRKMRHFKKLNQMPEKENVHSSYRSVWWKWCNGHLKSDTILLFLLYKIWWERTLPSPYSTLNANVCGVRVFAVLTHNKTIMNHDCQNGPSNRWTKINK